MRSPSQEPGESYSHPNRGTLGQPPMGGGDHLYLSAKQFHDHESEPSWRAPRRSGLSTGAAITLTIAIGVVMLVVFWATGVI